MEDLLEKKMCNYFGQLNEEEKLSVVQMLQVFLNGSLKNRNRISIDEYNKELDKAMEEVKRREVYSHEEVVRISKSW